MLLPANLPQILLSQLIIFCSITWGLVRDYRRQLIITSLVIGVCPPDHWEDIPPGANGQLDLERGFILPAS
jgi:hypothetical protein